MAMLTWDGTGDRLYETGVDRGVYYAMNDDGSYGDAVAWNGLTGVTESPDGADANDIYADNIKYLSLISKENWKGTIKAYTYPEEFNECMGNAKRNAIKAFFGQQTRRKFAISWRSLWGNDVVGDQFAYRVHIAWGLTAAPSEMDHATENDSPEAQEFSWEVSSIPPSTAQKIYTGGSTSVEKDIQPCSHVYVNSITANVGGTATTNPVCTRLENCLYGTDESSSGAGDDTDAAVPTLNELVTYLRTGSGLPDES